MKYLLVLLILCTGCDQAALTNLYPGDARDALPLSPGDCFPFEDLIISESSASFTLTGFTESASANIVAANGHEIVFAFTPGIVGNREIIYGEFVYSVTLNAVIAHRVYFIVVGGDGTPRLLGGSFSLQICNNN